MATSSDRRATLARRWPPALRCRRSWSTATHQSGLAAASRGRRPFGRRARRKDAKGGRARSPTSGRTGSRGSRASSVRRRARFRRDTAPPARPGRSASAQPIADVAQRRQMPAAGRGPPAAPKRANTSAVGPPPADTPGPAQAPACRATGSICSPMPRAIEGPGGEAHRHVGAERAPDLGERAGTEAEGPTGGRAAAASPPHRPSRRRARRRRECAWSAANAQAGEPVLPVASVARSAR